MCFIRRYLDEYFNKYYFRKLIKTMEEQMAKIDELGLAVSALQTTVDLVVVKIDELKAGNNDAALEGATVLINEAVSKLNGAIS